MCLLGFGWAQINFGNNLHFVTKKMLSKEGMECFKSVEVNTMIEQIRNVDGIDFPPLSSWSMDSHVKYEWKEFMKSGSTFEYREVKARAAVLIG